MNRRTFTALSIFGLALPLVARPSFAEPVAKKAAPATAELSANDIILRVQEVYDRAKTFKAGFKQRYYVKAHDKTKDSSGSVIFAKPGKMSWRYTQGNRVVSDGKLIKIYDQRLGQVYEQALDKTQYPAALSFLTGQGQLSQNFKFTKMDATVMKFESGYVLGGEPLQPTPAYQQVFFFVDARTFHVRRVIIQDAQGNRNRFDFLTAEVNTKPQRGEFVFTPPNGTQVIKP